MYYKKEEMKTEPHKEGYKTYNKAREYICANCQKSFIRYSNEIDYIFNKKRFCSWNCKCKYKKSHI